MSEIESSADALSSRSLLVTELITNTLWSLTVLDWGWRFLQASAEKEKFAWKQRTRWKSSILCVHKSISLALSFMPSLTALLFSSFCTSSAALICLTYTHSFTPHWFPFMLNAWLKSELNTLLGGFPAICHCHYCQQQGGSRHTHTHTHTSSFCSVDYKT